MKTALPTRWYLPSGACAALAILTMCLPARSAGHVTDAWPPATTGWIILAGPGGPDSACHVTRAYDLETGHAFRYDACRGGIVAGTTPAARVRDVMTALLGQAPSPWTVGEHRLVHTWRWLASTDRSLIGELEISDGGGRRGPDTITERLQALDAGLTAGCRPPLPPPSLTMVAVLPEMVQPVSADASQLLTERYRLARGRWAVMHPCGAVLEP